MGGAVRPNSSFHHSHHTSELELLAKYAQNDAGLFLAYCPLIKHTSYVYGGNFVRRERGSSEKAN